LGDASLPLSLSVCPSLSFSFSFFPSLSSFLSFYISPFPLSLPLLSLSHTFPLQQTHHCRLPFLSSLSHTHSLSNRRTIAAQSKAQPPGFGLFSSTPLSFFSSQHHFCIIAVTIAVKRDPDTFSKICKITKQSPNFQDLKL